MNDHDLNAAILDALDSVVPIIDGMAFPPEDRDLWEARVTVLREIRAGFAGPLFYGLPLG